MIIFLLHLGAFEGELQGLGVEGSVYLCTGFIRIPTFCRFLGDLGFLFYSLYLSSLSLKSFVYYCTITIIHCVITIHAMGIVLISTNIHCVDAFLPWTRVTATIDGHWWEVHVAHISVHSG